MLVTVQRASRRDAPPRHCVAGLARGTHASTASSGRPVRCRRSSYYGPAEGLRLRPLSSTARAARVRNSPSRARCTSTAASPKGPFRRRHCGVDPYDPLRSQLFGQPGAFTGADRLHTADTFERGPRVTLSSTKWASPARRHVRAARADGAADPLVWRARSRSTTLTARHPRRTNRDLSGGRRRTSSGKDSTLLAVCRASAVLRERRGDSCRWRNRSRDSRLGRRGYQPRMPPPR